MSHSLTPVDRELLTVLRLECARTQGYLIDRTGRSRQQVHTRLQILSSGPFLRAIHKPTAVYQYRTDTERDRDYDHDDDSSPVQLNLIDADGNKQGEEWVAVGPDGVPHSHRYSWDGDEDGDE